MNLLDRKLKQLKDENRVGVMAHLIAGYRSRQESLDVAMALAGNGADILEIQIPFSDPTADGPVITEACQAALKGGAKPGDALDLARTVIEETGTPVLLMSYFNILFRWPGGLEAFIKAAAETSVSGLIVPDIPPEETADPYYSLCRDAGIHPVVVLSPNMPEDRLRELKPFASGLVYATARVGTTGAASDVTDSGLQDFLAGAGRCLDLPIAVGFGIQSREQILGLQGAAQVGVTGTYLLRALNAGGIDGITEAIQSLNTG